MKQLKLKALDSEGPEGIFLVRVETAAHHWHGRKPVLHLQLSVLAPPEHHGRVVATSLECSPKNQWKLRWLLRDFQCPADSHDPNTIDLKVLLGLTGVVRTSLARSSGRLCLTLDGFSPAATWPEFAEVEP